MSESKSAQCISELHTIQALSAVAIAKLLHEETGEYAGQIEPCPICRSGVMRWTVASSNGHARVVCDRKTSDGSRCCLAME